MRLRALPICCSIMPFDDGTAAKALGGSSLRCRRALLTQFAGLPGSEIRAGHPCPDGALLGRFLP